MSFLRADSPCPLIGFGVAHLLGGTLASPVYNLCSIMRPSTILHYTHTRIYAYMHCIYARIHTFHYITSHHITLAYLTLLYSTLHYITFHTYIIHTGRFFHVVKVLCLSRLSTVACSMSLQISVRHGSYWLLFHVVKIICPSRFSTFAFSMSLNISVRHGCCWSLFPRRYSKVLRPVASSMSWKV